MIATGRGRSHAAHHAEPPPSRRGSSGSVPTRHHTANTTATSARPASAGRGASQSGHGPRRLPNTPSTSGSRSGMANDRGTSRRIGSNASGAAVSHASPARTPGTVIASGITRWRMSTQAAAARRPKSSWWAAQRSTTCIPGAATDPEPAPPCTSHHHVPRAVSITARATPLRTSRSDRGSGSTRHPPPAVTRAADARPATRGSAQPMGSRGSNARAGEIIRFTRRSPPARCCPASPARRRCTL